MQIYKIGESIKFQGVVKSFLLFPKSDTSNESNVLVDPFNIVKETSTKIINQAGEYEVDDITVQLFKLENKYSKDVNYAFTSLENINSLWLSDEVFSLSKEEIESLPQIHLLLLSLSSDPKKLEKQVDLISEIEPNYFTYVSSDKVSIAEFEKQYGEQAELNKKLKFKSEDFEGLEDSTTHFIKFD
ncbi:MAG: hypothetical protein WCK31_00745 [bacterium]